VNGYTIYSLGFVATGPMTLSFIDVTPAFGAFDSPRLGHPGSAPPGRPRQGAVPAPASLVLLGSALAVLAARTANG